MTSKIEWTEETWNIVTGCTRISEGCEHCYIERTPPMRMAHRRFDGPQIGATTGVQLHPERLGKPLHWRSPRRVFVNSMSDLFHEDVPDDFIAEVFGVMAANEEHTYQLLTKRPGRMRALLRSADFVARVRGNLRKRCGTHRRSLGGVCPVCHWNTSGNCAPEMSWPLHNAWIGVSVESQKWADIRIPQLLDTPAAVRWISAEPLLGPVDLTKWIPGRCACQPPGPSEGVHWTGCPALRYRGLDWVVVGGETGPGARPMHPAWARSLRDQCTAAGVPFFYKQAGDWAALGPLYEAADGSDHAEAWAAHLDAVDLEVNERRQVIQLEPDGAVVDPEEYQPVPGTWLMARLGKKRAGRLLDGREWNEFPAGVSG